MVNHCIRKIKCSCNSNKSYDECTILSNNIKFYFYFDIKTLKVDDIRFIVDNYNNDENHIYKDYRFILEEEEILDIENNIQNNVENYVLNNFNHLYYNFEKQRYVCNLCLSEYMSKQSMEKHLLNNKKCEKRRIILEVIIKNKNK